MPRRFPHTRGGDPVATIYEGQEVEVFPTHVGVILLELWLMINFTRFPHTRGGDPDDHGEDV